MEQVTVRIVKAELPTYWYAEFVGMTFVVYKSHKDYILKEDYDRGHQAAWRYISFDDCSEQIEVGQV